MPFASEAQRRLLWAKHPSIAKRWAHEYPEQKDLPMHVDEKPKTEKKIEPEVKAAHTRGSEMTFEEKIIASFQTSGAALSRAEKERTEKQAQDAVIAKLIPNCVEALFANGRIDAEDKTAAAAALADPVKAIELLTKVAAHRNATEVAHLGASVERNGQSGHTKKAAANSLESCRVGARSGEPKESDRRFLSGLGLA